MYHKGPVDDPGPINVITNMHEIISQMHMKDRY